MRYIYDIYNKCGKRLETNNYFDYGAIEAAILANGWVIVSDGSQTNSPTAYKIVDENSMVTWRDKIERTATWKPDVIEKKDAINPSHYQKYMSMELGSETIALQWLETMQYLSCFSDPSVFKGAILLQARKYIDRLGKKDGSTQDVLKSVWYLKFLAAFIKNGNKPIRVKDIDAILSSKSE